MTRRLVLAALALTAVTSTAASSAAADDWCTRSVISCLFDPDGPIWPLPQIPRIGGNPVHAGPLYRVTTGRGILWWSPEHGTFLRYPWQP